MFHANGVGRNIHVDVTQMSMTWLGGRVESI